MVRKRTLLSLLIGALSILIVSSSIYAAPSVVQVKGGSLTVSSSETPPPPEGNGTIAENPGFIFGTVTVDVSSVIPTKTAFEYVRADDNTGKNKGGWQVKVMATPLTATVNDETTAADDSVNISIPIDTVMQVEASGLTRIHGPSLKAGDITLSSGPLSEQGLTFMKSAKGKGQGAYYCKLDYTLSMPSYLPASATVTPDYPADSALDDVPVTDLSLFEGTYRTTITYFTVDAP